MLLIDRPHLQPRLRHLIRGKCCLNTSSFSYLISFRCCLVTKSCPTLCDPMDCSPPGSSVHGILQARILEWVAISFSRGSSQAGDQTRISCIGRWVLYHWSSLVIQTVKNLPAMWEQRKQKHKSVGTSRKALPTLMKGDRCS